jgi:hypothetical protein
MKHYISLSCSERLAAFPDNTKMINIYNVPQDFCEIHFSIINDRKSLVAHIEGGM